MASRRWQLIAVIALIAFAQRPSVSIASPQLFKCYWEEATAGPLRKPLLPSVSEAAQMWDETDPLYVEVDLLGTSARVIDPAIDLLGPATLRIDEAALTLVFNKPKISGLQNVAHNVLITIDRFDLSSRLILSVNARGAFGRKGRCLRPTF
jgi:hypothetical protein